MRKRLTKQMALHVVFTVFSYPVFRSFCGLRPLNVKGAKVVIKQKVERYEAYKSAPKASAMRF